MSIGGAILLRDHRGKRQYLVVKGKEGVWEVPKVIVRKGESSVRAVIRMVGEQVGISARVLEEAGRISSLTVVNGKSVPQKLYYYLMMQRSKGGEILGFSDFLWLENDKAYKKIESKKEKEIFNLMFARGAFDAYRLAAQSCLRSGHYDLSAAYFSKAFKIDPLDVNLRFFLNFSLGMNAYLLNSYPKALSSFTKLVSSAETAKWQRDYFKKAEEVCRKMFSELREEKRLKMAKTAGRIADQLKKGYS